MKLIDINASKPIYVQIAEGIEDDILRGNIREGEQVASTNQFAAFYQINPATAAKGINLLVDEEILFKKRGIGMFVAEGAVDYVRKKRRRSFYQDYILRMLEEGGKLDISRDEIIRMIQNEGGDGE